MKFLKTISTFGMLLMVGLMLTACSNSATRKIQQTSDQESAETANKELKLYHGTFLQGNGIVTVPVIVANGSQNNVLIASRNIKLYVDGKKVDILHASNQPSDFHDTVASNGGHWVNLLSFYIGTNLPRKYMDNLKLVYTTDDNKQLTAEAITKNQVQNLLSKDSNSNDNNTLSKYYSDMINFQEEQLTDSQSAKSLSDEFKDSKYDNLHTYIVTNKKDPTLALIHIENGTNTDFKLNLENLEVVDKSGSETIIDSEFRNYSVQIPHGKYINTLVKLEASLDSSQGPYVVKFKNNDENFFDTQKAPYPIEFAINSANGFDDAFVGAPDELNNDAVKWSKAKLKGTKLSVKVQLLGYFNLKVDKVSDYQLVGVDRDGNEGDKEKATSGAPMAITSNDVTELKLNFDDLKNLKTYKHIYLNYRDKRLTKIK